MAQRPEQSVCRRASGPGPCDAGNPLKSMKLRLRIVIRVAAALYIPGSLSFYNDNDSHGPRTALILSILQPASGFVTSLPRQRGVRWISAAILINYDHR